MKYCVTFAALTFAACFVYASVPTAEEYAHALEARFFAGESAASISSSFETNLLFTVNEILPYCYGFTADTNNLEQTIERYKEKLRFIDSLLPKYWFLTHMSSNTWQATVGHLEREEAVIQGAVLGRFEENPTPETYHYWKSRYPQSMIGPYSIMANNAICIKKAIECVKNPKSYLHDISRFPSHLGFDRFLNLDSYTDVFSRADLYAELSTNAQYNADAMFRYCLAERSDFATNNIAIAEKQIWRNNFVLEIVGHSCNLHTNAANRALDTAYTNKLAAIRAHYDAIPEPHLGMAGAELDEWRSRLGATIDAYTNAISPFRSGESD